MRTERYPLNLLTESSSLEPLPCCDIAARMFAVGESKDWETERGVENSCNMFSPGRRRRVEGWLKRLARKTHSVTL